MDTISRLFAVATSIFIVGGVTAFAAEAPVSYTAPATNSPQNASQRVWRDTTPLTKPKALCPQWWETAIKAGWTNKQLPTLDFIISRESRCVTQAHNTTLNQDGSEDLGLTQINDKSWCKPNRYNPVGYLQSLGIIDYCEQLFDPYTNLKAAKAIYDYSEKTNGNGFKPWGK